MIKSRGKSKRKVVSQIAVAEQTVENREFCNFISEISDEANLLIYSLPVN